MSRRNSRTGSDAVDFDLIFKEESSLDIFRRTSSGNLGKRFSRDFSDSPRGSMDFKRNSTDSLGDGSDLLNDPVITGIMKREEET